MVEILWFVFDLWNKWKIWNFYGKNYSSSQATDVSTQNRHSLQKPDWNRAFLSQDYIRWFKSFGLWFPKWYEINLSDKILNIDFSQGAAKISEVKVGVWKKYMPIGPARTHVRGVSRVSRYFFWPPTLTSGIFAKLWSKSIFSTSFERSISYLFVD